MHFPDKPDLPLADKLDGLVYSGGASNSLAIGQKTVFEYPNLLEIVSKAAFYSLHKELGDLISVDGDMLGKNMLVADWPDKGEAIRLCFATRVFEKIQADTIFFGGKIGGQ